MAKISRDDVKKHGFGRFLKSFKYSVEGLVYAYRYEQSMLIHFICTIGVVLANIFLKVTNIEWVITILALGVVLSSELINTAIEAAVDLVTLEIHPLAKIAKDCGSAATFVLSLMTGAICLAIYAPYVITLLGL